MAIKKYDSALRENVHMWVNKVKTMDILVGIPCFNNEDTIGFVIEQVTKGLAEHFPEYRTAVFVSDGGSLDNTRENAYQAVGPEEVQRRVTIYRGMPGKGTAFRAIFELATLLKVKAVAVVDSDLRSITPAWIKNLLDPILSKSAGFVVPFYRRHKFDGTITNQIVYPMTRALYGIDIRQPIGGDFGFCPELAAFYMNEDVWDSDVVRFGIDIWMTTCAINEGFPVAQTYLGAKIHDAKDPAADLGPMFHQVISTLFYLMGKYERNWQNENPPKLIPVNNMQETEADLEPISVSLNKLHDEFVDGFNHFRPMYEQILSPDNMTRLSAIHKAWSANEEAEITPELWSRIVFDFACVYQLWVRNRRHLVDMLTPLYFGRTKSFCQQVMDMDYAQAEAIVHDQAAIFQRNKPYLMQRFTEWKQKQAQDQRIVLGQG